jgi:hypothetical protein
LGVGVKKKEEEEEGGWSEHIYDVQCDFRVDGKGDMVTRERVAGRAI